MNEQQSISLSFLGDIALNDNYIQHYNAGSNPFEHITKLLQNTDLVVGNLEALCNGTQGFNELKKPTLFTSKPTLNYLKELNVGLVSVANNHVYDNLESGFDQTISFLKEKNIRYTGANTGKDQSISAEIISIKGKKFAFISYVHSDTNPSLPDDCKLNLNLYDFNKIGNEIRSLKIESDYIVLLLHWGLENSAFPAPWQRRHARKLIEAGADLIIGHHAHVVQGLEFFKNKPVYYGLGNFCFSSFKANGRVYELDRKRNTKSIIANIVINSEIKCFTTTIKNKNEWIYPDKVLDSKGLSFLSKLIPLVSNELVWPFYVFYVKVIYKSFFYFFGNNRNPMQQLMNLRFQKVVNYFFKPLARKNSRTNKK
jgi:poly-gamma-glutamate synthesis protein (capsule biosynthesis protein)